ncbi:MAG: type VI secretion system baseplate subunit TssF, partial [Candidatus Competibacteraceae bacterium]|nr:type VI secretion system baseplate subunit TssF [Candidatus Competibacteraceae bacterium]
MDPRLLRHYDRELQHLREMGAEFARSYPKIANRLGLEGFECADPYVERLLEGFAFLAARVQLKLEAEFPDFTQHLLEMVYPHYLAPTPSMAVVRFQPDLEEGSLGEGFTIPRDSVLRSLLGKGEQTPCEYRTAQDVTLWPLELQQAEYLGQVAPFTPLLPSGRKVRAGLRLRLKACAGFTFARLPLRELTFYLTGSGSLPVRLYERLLAGPVTVLARPQGAGTWQWLNKAAVVQKGFDEDQALLPYAPRSFGGYRLLHEYFAFPQRYLFVTLRGLEAGVRACAQEQLELVLLLEQADPELEGRVDADNLQLFCGPAINLFPKRLDRIHLDERRHEYHLLADRTRPQDFEIHTVTGVTGLGSGPDSEQAFRPFYGADDFTGPAPGAYYTLRREPRLLSSRQQRQGTRSSYVGSESFIALVDARQAPYSSELRQLAVTALCSNRDLPLQMPLGRSGTDFNLDIGAPVESVRVIAGPTRPRPALADGAEAWRLISHLSLNYLSLLNDPRGEGAEALRTLLLLYLGTARDAEATALRRQIEGLRSVSARGVTRRLPVAGPITFGRGLEVELTFEEMAFEGSGPFLLGAVLERFLARYVSLNSFTETRITT